MLLEVCACAASSTYVLVLLEVCVCMFYEGVCLCYT